MLSAAGAACERHTTFTLPVGQGSKDLHECCFGDAALDLAQQLTTSVETGINVRAAASINQVRYLDIRRMQLAITSPAWNPGSCAKPADNTCISHLLRSVSLILVHRTAYQTFLTVMPFLQIYAVACHSSAAQLHCQVALPGASVLLTPLYAKKICQVPLSQSLQASLQQPAAKTPQNGLLSMDQARSLLPLLADDPNVR